MPPLTRVSSVKLTLSLHPASSRAIFYARCNVSYVFGDTWTAQTGYKIFLLIMLFIGGVAAYEFVWELGDLGVGLMTVFNMIAIVPLSGQAINALKDYETNYKKKKI